MTTDFRALCADLLRELDHASAWDYQQALKDQARAALAEPGSQAEMLAVRPMMEQIAAMGDCIGQQTVRQIMAISQRAAAWLAENPPGQPVAIEPRGCPTPGACSCVMPSTRAALAEPEPISDAFAVVQERLDELANDQEMMLYRWPDGEWSIDHSNPSSHVQLGEVCGEYRCAGRTLEEVVDKIAELLPAHALPVPAPTSEND